MGDSSLDTLVDYVPQFLRRAERVRLERRPAVPEAEEHALRAIFAYDSAPEAARHSMVRVFVTSFPHGSPHLDRVRDLAERLRKDEGLSVVFSGDGRIQGWDAWVARQVREADRVLIACWVLAFDGNDELMVPPVDSGTAAIQQALRENTKAGVVLIGWSSKAIEDSPQLRKYRYFLPDDPESYRECIAWLRTAAVASETDSGTAGASIAARVKETDASPRTRAQSLFLCYRREDTQDAAGRLHDRLTAAYGSERVFMDIDSVPLGIDFVEHVTEQISRCSVVIVMIGKQWLTITGRKQRRRLDNQDDLVRAEIRAALQQKIPVIPVVVQNGSMPDPEDLPDDIRLLARRNGIQLRPDQWKDGVERLLRELDPVIGKRQS